MENENEFVMIGIILSGILMGESNEFSVFSKWMIWWSTDDNIKLQFNSLTKCFNLPCTTVSVGWQWPLRIERCLKPSVPHHQAAWTIPTVLVHLSRYRLIMDTLLILGMLRWVTSVMRALKMNQIWIRSPGKIKLGFLHPTPFFFLLIAATWILHCQ